MRGRRPRRGIVRLVLAPGRPPEPRPLRAPVSQTPEVVSMRRSLMSVPSYLAKLFRGGSRRKQAPVRKPMRSRLALEALEDRQLLSILTVTSAADEGPGTLRQTIAVAESGDTIQFSPSLNGQTISLTSGELQLTRSLNIQGPGASNLGIAS